jgi:hypothetical protein
MSPNWTAAKAAFEIGKGPQHVMTLSESDVKRLDFVTDDEQISSYPVRTIW